MRPINFYKSTKNRSKPAWNKELAGLNIQHVYQNGIKLSGINKRSAGKREIHIFNYKKEISLLLLLKSNDLVQHRDDITAMFSLAQ